MPVHVQMNGFVTKLTLRAGVIVKEVLTIVALVLVANTSCQAAWPERSIRFIVPVAAGGGVDIMSRILADRLSQRLLSARRRRKCLRWRRVDCSAHRCQIRPRRTHLLAGVSGPRRCAGDLSSVPL